jgi:hypothetical protein
MGALCSKSSTLSGGHTLGSPTPIDNSGMPQQRPQRRPQQLPQQHHAPRQHSHPQAEEARRGQAAAAAERRMKAVRLFFSHPIPSVPPALSCRELATLTSVLKYFPPRTITERKTSEGSMPPILIQDGSRPNWKHQGLHLMCQNRAGGKTPLS